MSGEYAMHRRRSPLSTALVAGFVAAIAVTGCRPADPTPPDPMLDERTLVAQIHQTLERYGLAVSQGDAAGLRDMYVLDGRFTWIEDGEVRYRSPEEVLEALASLGPDMPVVTDFGEIGTALVRDVAAHAWVPFTTTIGEGAGAFQFSGMLSFVLERNGDQWRIVGGHTSSERAR